MLDAANSLLPGRKPTDHAMPHRPSPAYSHTQVGWWLLVALGFPALAMIAIFAGAGRGQLSLPPSGSRIVGGIVVVALLLSALLFSTLTVRVTADAVAWRFGPGLIRFTLPLGEVTNVSPSRTPLWAGIGIHWIFTGWVYNVSGRDAVQLTKRDGSKLWIGTDEPELLAAAIESARGEIGPAAGAAPRPGTR